MKEEAHRLYLSAFNPNIKKKPSADNGCNDFSLDSYFIPILFLQKNI